jgi:polyhydroxyalkanoate synthesis regulator phasin
MARETVNNEGLNGTSTEKETLLQSGLDLVKTAREEAGELVHRIEENAEALREKVQDTLEDLQEVSLSDVPATIEKGVKKQSRQASKQVKAWKKRLVKGSKGFWKDILRGFRKASDTLGSGVEPLIHTAGLASKRDIGRIEKKLERLIRKVRQLEKRQ